MNTPPPPLVLIVGWGRSGTTWLGRILDSAPTTLYLHEPDLVLYDAAFPVVPRPEEMAALTPAAARLLDRWVAGRPLRAVASRPLFRKPCRSPSAHLLRAGTILLLRGVESLLGRELSAVRVPDLIDRPRHRPQTVVIKSVTALARLPALLAARPEMPVVHLLRHPAAVAASHLRGATLGRMPRPRLYERQLSLPAARRHRLEPRQVARMSDLEQAVWAWVIMHEEAMAQRPAGARVLDLRYEDLCRDPKGTAQRLFSWCGIPWTAQTAAFIEATTRPAAGLAGYHSVQRDPRTAMERWRHQLSEHQQAVVAEIVRDSLPGQLYAEWG